MRVVNGTFEFFDKKGRVRKSVVAEPDYGFRFSGMNVYGGPDDLSFINDDFTVSVSFVKGSDKLRASPDGIRAPSSKFRVPQRGFVRHLRSSAGTEIEIT